jgi:hypothetical protein
VLVRPVRHADPLRIGSPRACRLASWTLTSPLAGTFTKSDLSMAKFFPTSAEMSNASRYGVPLTIHIELAPVNFVRDW